MGRNLIPRASANYSEEEHARLINACLRAREVTLRRLGDAKNQMSRRDQARAARSYLGDEPIRVATLFLSLRKRRVSIGPNSRWPWSSIVETGRRLNAFDSAHRPLRVAQIERSGGADPRLIFCLSHVDYARHRLAAEVARALFIPHPRQFVCTTGELGLATWLRERLPETQLVLATDFPRFFLSLNRQRLMSVTPMPRRVTEALLCEPFAGTGSAPAKTGLGVNGRVIAPNNLTRATLGWISVEDWFELSATCAEGLRDGWGIPPGSPLSQVYSQAALHSIILAVENAADGVECGCFADNLIILLRDASAKAVVERALAQAVRDVIRDDCQKELLRRITPSTPSAGFQFIGYQIWLDGAAVRFGSSEGVWAALEDQLLAVAATDPTSLTENAVINRIVSRVRVLDNAPSVNGRALGLAYRAARLAGQVTRPSLPPRPPVPATVIYTDGTATPGHGPGAWAAIFHEGGTERRCAGASPLTTNNEMELTAAVEALEQLESPQVVRLLSDSRYLVQNASDRLENWRRRAWRTSSGRGISHRELWMRLAKQLQRHAVELVWVRGHSGDAGNRQAHSLASSTLRAYRLGRSIT